MSGDSSAKDGIPTQHSSQSPWESEHASNESSQQSSRQQSRRPDRQTQRPPHKVTFSIADDQAESNPHRPVDSSHTHPESTVPEIHFSTPDVVTDIPSSSSWTGRTHAAAAYAQSRASRLADKLSSGERRNKTPSGSNTPLMAPPQVYTPPNLSPPQRPLDDWLVNVGDVPLESLDRDKRPYTIHDDTTDDESDVEKPEPLKRDDENLEEARRLIRTLTKGHNLGIPQDTRSGTATPAIDKYLHDVDYIPPPDEYRPGVFGAILSSKLANLAHSGFSPRNYQVESHSPTHGRHKHSQAHSRAGSSIPNSSEHSSGRATPSKRPKWYEQRPHSTGSMAALLAQASITSAAPAAPGTAGSVPRPPTHRAKSSNSMIATAVDMIKHPGNHFHAKSEQIRRAEEEQVIHDVAEIIACRKYLKRLGRSLMAVGAPSHRLEEYMKTSARALGIDGDFLYLPGSMIVSLNDKLTMSTEVTLLRESQNVELGRFKDVFEIYKLVIHGKYTAQEGTDELEIVMKKPPHNKTIWRIFAYGIAAIAVGPFAFSARPIDFGPSFLLGCTLGFLQLVVTTKSSQFSHVFEVLASVMIAFVARGLGSIYHNGKPVFCFSAIAQSSIALILPGYTVLCAALELQSKNLVAGSVRMVYAIIYSLFLGFGILIGTVLMGLVYPDAQDDVTCDIPPWWDASDLNYILIYTRFLWVPIFAVCLAFINQAKWRQVPVMALIAFCGYQANFWISTRIANNIQVSNAIGAFVVGCMANLYSRFFHGLAAAAMLPSIFVQVPSGLAASGSLVAGITSANQISGNATGVSIVSNGTAGFLNAQNGTSTDVYGGTIFNVGYGMVQVAIGISVGLYMSALIVYPIGKRRSGLFSF
ncbi:hypothetical protein, variant 1 [Exophiala mesophila]|uniref:Threonine/serine exporter-like N-terminal domain-containing protein n=1 Tax=Exophiala mesophila TaxID=212818 RepID=A0A0D1Z3T4_EXOME|nr:hypothetical protein, variant 1 [Exophiala mesophila]KIV88524.1 hypothetical protein, variant 1 [Exophiala mesophila]